MATRGRGKKGTGTICAKHPPGRSGKWCLSPFSPFFPAADSAAEKRPWCWARGEFIIQSVGRISPTRWPYPSKRTKGPFAVLTVRPKVAELVFQLYGRALHPELFEVHASQTVVRDEYQAKIDITSAGHVVTWRRAGLTLTEVATAAHHPLPQRRRLMSYRLKGQRSDRVECRGGVCYQVCLLYTSPSPRD